MDNLNPIQTLLLQAVAHPPQISDAATEAKKEQFAKDFESVFLEKLFDEMKNSIGDWGFEKDAASGQVQGLFWMQLAQDVSAKGGMGLWKEIYRSLQEAEAPNRGAGGLDKTL